MHSEQTIIHQVSRTWEKSPGKNVPPKEKLLVATPGQPVFAAPSTETGRTSAVVPGQEAGTPEKKKKNRGMFTS